MQTNNHHSSFKSDTFWNKTEHKQYFSCWLSILNRKVYCIQIKQWLSNKSDNLLYLGNINPSHFFHGFWQLDNNIKQFTSKFGRTNCTIATGHHSYLLAGRQRCSNFCSHLKKRMTFKRELASKKWFKWSKEEDVKFGRQGYFNVSKLSAFYNNEDSLNNCANCNISFSFIFLHFSSCSFFFLCLLSFPLKRTKPSLEARSHRTQQKT